ncbi:MAG TPA: hypothetical protein VIE67_01135, partial [Rudaea sp.]|uniref:hypothetical protein n=1 Tax=Rudaea sp. TaxID=2136325 RepID=UPI002F95BD87
GHRVQMRRNIGAGEGFHLDHEAHDSESDFCCKGSAWLWHEWRIRLGLRWIAIKTSKQRIWIPAKSTRE